jgi:hypothetical protein
MRNKKLKVRIGLAPGVARDPTPPVSTHLKLQTPTMAAVPEAPERMPAPQAKPAPEAMPAHAAPNVLDYTFEEYKAANLNINQQQSLISTIRNELPLVDRDEVDSLILQDVAKQLQLCVFPMCKMMQIDPLAVKRMMDEQFRKAYGIEVDQAVTEKQEKTTQLNKTGVQQDGT